MIQGGARYGSLALGFVVQAVGVRGGMVGLFLTRSLLGLWWGRASLIFYAAERQPSYRPAFQGRLTHSR